MTTKPDSTRISSTRVMAFVPLLLLAAVIASGISWYRATSSVAGPDLLAATLLVSYQEEASEPKTRAVAAAASTETDEDESPGEDRFLTNIRQRTSTGLRSGEGYFSEDGNRMVFQSERSPDNPFYQIFVMDFEMGDVIPVSPGHGKTTCAWIHPDGRRVMYASTQDDPEALQKQKEKLELRASGRDSRYNWDYDETYELYAYDLQSKNYTQLTNAVGYDAEGSYSPDGTKIAFASNRRAYMDGELTDLEQQQFDFHQAAVMDIYIMDADGSNVTRLTEEPGYDGGPFLFPRRTTDLLETLQAGHVQRRNLDDEHRWQRQTGTDRLGTYFFRSVLSSIERIHPVYVEPGRLRQL